MNRSMWVACLWAALTLAGCGSKDAGKAAADAGRSAKPSAAAPSGAATAEQVARELRGKVKCPAKASTPRPADAPVDDVVGVRPGMSWDEAANFVMCDRPLLVVTENTSRGYNINTYGQHLRQGFDARLAEPHVVKTSQQILKEMEEESIRRGTNAYVAPLQAGQVRYYVSTMGLPGREQVVSVAREEYFQADKLPTVDTVAQALLGKYGDPTRSDDSGDFVSFWWEYDPAGAKLTQRSQAYTTCQIAVSPDAGTSLSTACGVTVGAMIRRAAANRGLAHSLAVSSQNGAAGYALLSSTANALRAADEARKAKELKDASKNANAPTL